MTSTLLDHLHTMTGDASAVNDYQRQRHTQTQNNNNRPHGGNQSQTQRR